ncbi:MAG: hypothetical protein ACOYOU_01760 [Kiritimatiellia bacterium]
MNLFGQSDNGQLPPSGYEPWGEKQSLWRRVKKTLGVVGVHVGAPVFIPFMGAFIAMKEAPREECAQAGCVS